MPKNYVLIPAAGLGSRMGLELPKQYLPLLDKPLIHHTLAIFCLHPALIEVCVLLHPEDRFWERYAREPALAKCRMLRCGGETRAATVLNGLQALAGELDGDDWVLVHDAARPCMTTELLQRLLTELADDAVGGLLAVPVADTLKRAGTGDRVVRTERSEERRVGKECRS